MYGNIESDAYVCYIYNMRKSIATIMKHKKFPVIVERDEDGFYIVECPILSGCFSQGKTLDKALKNIREAIELCMEEKYNQEIIKEYNPKEVSLHTISV